MNHWKTWLARLGIAGACLVVTGCGGGGGVPDPGSDAQAAPDVASGAGGKPPAAAAAGEAPKAAEAAPAPGQEGGAPAAPAQHKGGSTTSEMLALATGPSGGSNPPAAGGTTAPSANAQSPGAGGAGAPTGPAGPGAALPGGGMGGGGQQAEADAAAARRAAISKNRQNELREEQGIEQGMMKAQAERRKDVIARFGNVGGGGPGGGGPGGRGGAGADSAPGNFHTPSNAVTSFLNALQARDADRLAEATALRAALESSSKTQPWFEKILGLSLSDSELDDLAKKLEGFTVSGENPPKSTGRVEVVLQKALAGNVGYVRRTVVVRHEKKGWGVLDIGGPSEFKMPTMRPLNKTTGRRNY